MEFRTLTAHHNGYQVSECGTVIISPKTGKNITIQNNLVKGKFSGYMYATLLFTVKDGFFHYSIKRMCVHRLVCELWHGEMPANKPWVNHKDGNPSNNHYTNLEWMSISENIKHSYDTLNRVRNKPMLGKKHKVSTKEKQSFSKQGLKHPKFKGWYERNGNRYVTMAEAGKAQGISSTEVMRRVRAGKDNWTFIPKEEPVNN